MLLSVREDRKKGLTSAIFSKTARIMSVGIHAILDLLLLIQQKLCIVKYRYVSLSLFSVRREIFYFLLDRLGFIVTCTLVTLELLTGIHGNGYGLH